VCGTGIAPKAKVAGIRLIDGDITDTEEAKALSHALNLVDIYSSSWGPMDDGQTVEGPGKRTLAALQRGVRDGRDGLGAVYLFASGNGQNIDDCNCDGYANSVYTLSIGAVDSNHNQPWYSESCSAMIAVTYSSGEDNEPGISTIDVGGECTDEHSGTSAATPLAAGIISLVLSANPLLTWRDIQHLIVETATKVNEDDLSWSLNGASHLVSHKYGFGLLNAGAMVRAGLLWNSVGSLEVSTVNGGPQMSSIDPQAGRQILEIADSKNAELGLMEYANFARSDESHGECCIDRLSIIENTLDSVACLYAKSLTVLIVTASAPQNTIGVDSIETVAVTLTILHECRGDLEIIIYSPMGSRCVLES
ncbi:hypothetical protein SARC_12514, partial [Sphaeroforma arctica JP610]